MLHALLTKIDEALLNQACADSWSETPTLEWKAMLPRGEEKDRDEFRKDVCAMANAEGGDIVFGIAEKDAKAVSVKPISDRLFDNAKRTLLNILESRVDPRVNGLQFHEVAVAGGYVMVLRIPATFIGPHRCGTPPNERFVMRVDSKTTDMSYNQIREAFNQGTTLLERARRFIEDRERRLAQAHWPVLLANGPKFVFHVLPLSSLAGRVSINVPELLNQPQHLMREGQMNWSLRPSLQGIVMHPPGGEEPPFESALLFRNGCLEIHQNAAGDTSDQAPVRGLDAGRLVKGTLDMYIKLAATLGVSGPAVISLALVHGMGRKLEVDFHGRVSSARAGEGAHVFPEVFVDDISSASMPIDILMRPMIDVLYQSFGVPRCYNFDKVTGLWIG